jgi:hypothetical protein
MLKISNQTNLPLNFEFNQNFIKIFLQTKYQFEIYDAI